MSSVHKLYKWVKTVLDGDVTVREDFAQIVLDNLADCYNDISRKNPGGVSENIPQISEIETTPFDDDYEPDTKEEVENVAPEALRELFDAINDGRLEIMGITPEISYVRIRGSQDDLDPIWVHRFGTAKILMKVRGAPIMVIVGTHLKLNRSEVTPIMGKSERVTGATG